VTRLVGFAAVLVLASCTAAAPRPADEAPDAPPAQVVAVTAKRFEFNPSVIHLKAGAPAVIELTSLDRRHGFAAPDLGIDAEINPGAPTLVRVTPQTPGEYPFHCSVFCGEGHEGMAGRIVVDP
jgi:cytochrome c oxidase subunit 2